MKIDLINTIVRMLVDNPQRNNFERLCSQGNRSVKHTVKESVMYKAKWYNTTGEENTEEFRTEREMCICIYDEMQKQYDLMCDKYPNEDVTWLNRYLDCGNVTEVYVPDTNVCFSCEIIIDGWDTLEEW